MSRISRRVTDNPLNALNLTENENKRFQRIRLTAMAARSKTLRVVGCDDEAQGTELSDANFLLNLIERSLKNG